MNWPLYHYTMILSLITIFGLKSILSDISIATLTFFSLPFAWSIFFHPSTLSPCLSLKLKWASCRQHIFRSWGVFSIQPLCAFFKKIYLFSCTRSSLRHMGPLLQHKESLVASCKLLVVACGIQLPDQGSNLGPLHREHGVLATGPRGKSLLCAFWLVSSIHLLLE